MGLPPKKVKYKYGTLNGVQKNKFKRRVETNSNNFVAQAREAVREVLFNQSLDLTGEFIGVVLTKPLNATTNKDNISFFQRIFDAVGASDSTPEYDEYKVRVPEIHAMIPEPDNLGDNVSSSDKINISLHDTFTAIRGEVDQLNPSEFVVVTFYDQEGEYKPQIKRRLNVGDQRAVLEKGVLSTRQDEESEMCARVPQGDKIGSGEKGGENTQVAVECVKVTGAVENLTNHIGKTRVEVVPAVAYTENRVVFNEAFGAIPANSSLLVNVTSRQGQRKLHKLVAERFEAMVAAAAKDKVEISAQSAWRKRGPWENKEEYDKWLKKRYVDNPESDVTTLKEARGLKAYESPHEIGLAVDIYIPAQDDTEIAVAPSQPVNIDSRGQLYGSQTNSEQKKSKGFKWMKENAHKYGFTPLYHEAWHWECLIPINAWKTGQAITEEYDITDYSVRVIETSIANGSKTSDRDFKYE